MEQEDLLQKPLVAVVILSWNGKTFLEKFLPSVLASSYLPLDIYIADNASTDDTISFLEKNYAHIKIIRIQKNEGFAKGYNIALRQVHADYLILLNQDVEVTESWIEPLVEVMESDPYIAACQPKIKSFNNKNYFEHAGAAGGYIDLFGYPFCRGRIFDHVEEDVNQFEQPEEIFWASGAAMCVRSDLFKRYKGFDDDFFAHMEEIDLCWRWKRAGYKIKYVPQSIVYHVGGGSLNKESPKKIYLNFRNNLYMNFKNYELYEVVWKLPFRFFILDFIAFIKAIFEGKWGEAGAILRADVRFLISIPFLLRKRVDTFFIYWKHRIEPSRVKQKGYYRKSIVWKYFIKKKKTFEEL
ncbi:MAG: glycosyltransferase family 2 protein [Fimbriimonadaceae bacterium]|nr:glycosyltransferase family 2 protein [Chitinophagales bacterium]